MFWRFHVFRKLVPGGNVVLSGMVSEMKTTASASVGVGGGVGVALAVGLGVGDGVIAEQALPLQTPQSDEGRQVS